MNYAQTVDYLFTRLPLFSRIGAAAYKADLDNTIRLCASLGNPQDHFKSIHIAGTNGKGSVSHMLAAIFQAAGYRTGLYTSPHLKDFRERIRVNGNMIDEHFVIDFTARIQQQIEQIEPSFFEITVAMAFEYFANEKVDIAIIETGLGGRLDSTNIILPELAVITNIGWDHMNLLGNSLEAIAGEKAGIIKENIPVVVGEVIPPTQPVFERVAAAKNAPLSIATHTRQALEWKWEKHELVISVAEPNKPDHETYHLDLPGLYQTKNLLTVLEAVTQLRHRGWKIDDHFVHAGLRHVKKTTGLHGRWDILQYQPLVVLDVAHNEAGIRQVMEQVEVTDHHQLHIIIGMVKDKEVDKVLALLPKQATYYFTRADIPRSLPVEDLLKLAGNHALSGDIYPNVNIALRAARDKAGIKDMILVCGSIFLIGEVNS